MGEMNCRLFRKNDYKKIYNEDERNEMHNEDEKSLRGIKIKMKGIRLIKMRMQEIVEYKKF